MVSAVVVNAVVIRVDFAAVVLSDSVSTVVAAVLVVAAVVAAVVVSTELTGVAVVAEEVARLVVSTPVTVAIADAVLAVSYTHLTLPTKRIV